MRFLLNYLCIYILILYENIFSTSQYIFSTFGHHIQFGNKPLTEARWVSLYFYGSFCLYPSVFPYHKTKSILLQTSLLS